MIPYFYLILHLPPFIYFTLTSQSPLWALCICRLWRKEIQSMASGATDGDAYGFKK